MERSEDMDNFLQDTGQNESWSTKQHSPKTPSSQFSPFSPYLNSNYINSPSPTESSNGNNRFTNPPQAIYVGNGPSTSSPSTNHDTENPGEDSNNNTQLDEDLDEDEFGGGSGTVENEGTSSNSPPTVDEQGNPIKIRKKPGRKPNPASPALRKAQNRAAQRAFRERKERHLRDLELTIRSLRDQRNNAVKELHGVKSKMDAFKAETWYLKGVVLTLQFVCLHNNIHIPTHSPYLTEETLAEMAKTAPHAIEAYVNAYTRNNVNLKPTMASHISNTRHDINNTDDLLYDRSANYNRKTELLETLQQHHQQQQQHLQPQQNDTSALYVGEDTINTPSSYQAMTQAAAAAAAGRHSSSVDSTSWQRSSISSNNNNGGNNTNQQGVDHQVDVDMDMDMDTGSDLYNRVKKERPDEDISMAQWLQQQGITQQQIGQMTTGGGNDPSTGGPSSGTSKSNPQQNTNNDNGTDGQNDKDQIHNLSAIQRIRLQLRIQSALSSNNKNSERLQPTILQLAIPHDPRIDLIPTPHMRDRMIIFRDQINYDECFDLLLNGTRYHGGDPTESDNWEMDPSFIQEYWYLMLGYDVHKTNKWRRLKGLPEIPSGPNTGDERWLSNFQNQHPFFDNTREESLPPFVDDDALSPSSAWTDEVFRQMVESMPPLQPVINNNYPFTMNSNNIDAASLNQYPQSHHHQLLQLLQQQQQQQEQQLLQQQ
ncbi:hypothetical protein BC941DRAFT_502398, partial [Chlamydoabsidia padenii]